MDISSPGIARHNKKTPRCEHHDALLQPEQRTEFAARFPAGHQAQMAFLLAHYAGNASLVAALLGTGVRTVRRHRPGSGCAGPCAAVSWTSCARGACPIVRWNRRARRIGKPGARPDGFRVIPAAWIADTPGAREPSAPSEL